MPLPMEGGVQAHSAGVAAGFNRVSGIIVSILAVVGLAIQHLRVKITVVDDPVPTVQRRAQGRVDFGKRWRRGQVFVWNAVNLISARRDETARPNSLIEQDL